MAAMQSYNPFAPEVKENPYPVYEWLRREHPVYHNEELDFWVLSRYGGRRRGGGAPARGFFFGAGRRAGPRRRGRP